ncbi:hypothetical protein AAFF_G00431290 [Aldrovandia affinis]|uniref:Uncharacterized protein n=1 Tax=Aldrovandia affinis TaxID=143900 RepID=A0AAD7WIC7_9TELE|nr:hypothetical protein AAFF_G00431290 [Aldrovandia affinis]
MHGRSGACWLWSWFPTADCKHCPRQEALAQLVPTVATLQTIDGEAGCLPLCPVQVQEEQEHDAALTQVRNCLAARVGGRGRPGH